ncbi:gliding motility-associated protein GldE [Segetibacter sp. 3557_3]|uniref:gliding motility-associated protein GldE n=1 Tax=Segetibacter sp. 3557_3 TaxID=2547429 RepID=UPI001058B2E4|nr:gliding motility-associated protein GldE [Segetibacter sp. 3557_3]TDH24060.1 gliding motility-associated protein GldE [Segetibacter sp. 3557_3]
MDHHPVIFNLLFAASPTAINIQATTILIFLLIIFIVISFFVSGAEVAFFSLSFKDINMLKTKQQPGYKRIVDLLEDPKILLASLLIANSFVNIAIVVVSNFIMDEMILLDNHLFWVEFLIKVLAVTLILVMFGEVMPKVMATQNNIRFAKDAGPLVEGILYLFKGMSERLVGTSDFIERKLAGRTGSAYSLTELDHAIDLTTDNSASEKEKNILKGIVKFGNITVKQIMKARLDVSGIPYETSFKGLVKTIEELHYSRLPVFKDDLDEVVGMLHTKDLLPYLDNREEFDWHQIMRLPYFVHEQKMIEDLLKEFQAKRIHFAVVVDEFGGTSGIVTLEDILEEIIGDIRDEFDEDDVVYKKIDDLNFIFEGKTMINDVCKLMGLAADTFDTVRGSSDSLAGLVLEIAGEIPQPNQVVPSGDFEFTVMEVVKNRLQKVKVSIQPQKTK